MSTVPWASCDKAQFLSVARNLFSGWPSTMRLDVGHGSANFLYKGPESKYFKLSGVGVAVTAFQ